MNERLCHGMWYAPVCAGDYNDEALGHKVIESKGRAVKPKCDRRSWRGWGRDGVAESKSLHIVPYNRP